VLELQASLAARNSRTLTIACTGRAGNRELVRADGTFVEADLRRLLGEMADL
jgi:hypothetical protein